MYNAALLFCHLLIISTVEAGTGGVSFWRDKFTMTCPENGSWFKKEQPMDTPGHSLTVDGKNKGLYHCEYVQNNKKLKYYFYVEGKVCANCFELDAALFGALIVADVSITVLLMIFIYKCTKKKSSPGMRGPTGPAVPSRDYDYLNAHGQSQDPYSFLSTAANQNEPPMAGYKLKTEDKQLN